MHGTLGQPIAPPPSNPFAAMFHRVASGQPLATVQAQADIGPMAATAVIVGILAGTVVALTWISK